MSSPQYLHIDAGKRAAELGDGVLPPLVGEGLDGREALFVHGVVNVALGGAVDELDVVVLAGTVEAPVGGVGEHDLLLEAEFATLEEDPLVGCADDGGVAEEAVGLDGEVAVEAGLLDADDVGDVAEPG